MKSKAYCPYCRHSLVTTGFYFLGYTVCRCYHCAACDKEWSIKEITDET